MRSPANQSDRTIKKLENEIVGLERDYTALLRKKWKMEAEIRDQKEKISVLESASEQEKSKKSFWAKIALTLAALWAVFLSFFDTDKK
jgi:uncharacterized protein YoxC